VITMRWFRTLNNLSKYHLLLKDSQEIILFFDRSGRITDHSTQAQEELGYDENISRLQIGSVFKDVFMFEEDHIKTNEIFLGKISETVAYRSNQTCFPVKLKVMEYCNHNRYTGVCTAVNIEDSKYASREISELKRELSNSSQVSSELVTKVAHELRTPINGIMGFISNLMEMDLQPIQREAVNIIQKCANNLSSLINVLMDYTMISSQRLTLEENEFDFLEFIHRIVYNHMGSINEKGLKYLHSIADDIPDRLIGDEVRLTQILNNLFSNAIKFTPSGQISLKIIKLVQTNSDVELLFMVNDTGIGIERDKIGMIFQSFSQIDSSISRKYGGTGLGLSICRKYIEDMKGTITVDSERDKGSTFSFTVRLALPQEQGIFVSKSEEDEYIRKVTNVEVNSDSGVTLFDCISKELMSFKVDLKKPADNTRLKDSIDTDDLLTSIAICIEMEKWEKAERLACKLKDLIPKYQYLSSKEILRLLFAIRRENHANSFSILNEIKSKIC
jgi:signal transduction histidine kinase